MKVERARLKGREVNPKLQEVAERLRNEDPLYVSVATRYEVERGMLALGAGRSWVAFRRFLAETHVLSAEISGLTGKTVWDQAAATWAAARRSGYTSNSDADVLIVATAQVFGLTLVTHDGGMKLMAAAQDPAVSVEDWLE